MSALDLTAACAECGRVHWAGACPACAGVPPELAVCAADLPEGTPHPDPRLAAGGWQVAGGLYQRIVPGGPDAA